jgi:hypothetical protein
LAIKNFLCLFKNKIIYNFWRQNGRTKKNFPPLFGAVVGYGIDKNQDPGGNIPDPQHWLTIQPSLMACLSFMSSARCGGCFSSTRHLVQVRVLPFSLRPGNQGFLS